MDARVAVHALQARLNLAAPHMSAWHATRPSCRMRSLWSFCRQITRCRAMRMPCRSSPASGNPSSSTSGPSSPTPVCIYQRSCYIRCRKADLSPVLCRTSATTVAAQLHATTRACHATRTDFSTAMCCAISASAPSFCLISARSASIGSAAAAERFCCAAIIPPAVCCGCRGCRPGLSTPQMEEGFVHPEDVLASASATIPMLFAVLRQWEVRQHLSTMHSMRRLAVMPSRSH